MRVLLVHNFYGSSAPSGENQVFEAEKSMLERHGVAVETYTRHSDEIRGGCAKIKGLLKGALCTIANPFAAQALAKKCREFKPDVVHFHNTFPLISPLAVRAASKYAPVVMTLHNYRTVCAAGIPMRGGRVCGDCLVCRNSQRIDAVLPAIRHRCYRGSLLATLPLALNIAIYRRFWAKWVTRFICLTPFARQMMVKAGFPEGKIVVKGNFVSEAKAKAGEREGRFLYVGRLSEEKGVRTLIEAWNLMGENAPPLKIVGDGDRRGEYEAMAKADIRFVGQMPHDEVMAEIARAKAVLIPSICYEGLPTALMEAFSVGTPVIASDLGALPSLVADCGDVFEAGSAKALAAAVERMLNREDYGRMCSRVERCAAERYTEEANYARLMEIYGMVCEKG